jgi:hypothetical protein
MGQQTGVVRIRGKVGNLTFAKTANGDEVRLSTSLTGDKMRKDKRFKRTRENWAEFARAGRAARLIRNAFAVATKSIADARAYTRLATLALRVVKSDPTSSRGERILQLGDFSNFVDYEFNVNQSMRSTFKEQFELLIDRAAGTADINIPELIPEIAIAELEGSTHFKMTAAVAELEWDTEDFVLDTAETSEMVYGNQLEAAQSLNLTFPAGSTKTILVALGVWFYQEVNGQFYALQDGGRNAMALVGVDNV